MIVDHMKSILIIAALLFSAIAFAQDAPKVFNKPPVQVKPKAPVRCKPLGTVEGTKLWAGDCVANELRRNEARGPIVARPPAEEKKW
jgi:hypothetical protein